MLEIRDEANGGVQFLIPMLCLNPFNVKRPAG